MELRLGDIFLQLVGSDVPVALRAYDGSEFVPAAPAVGTIDVVRPRALRYVATAPGELGLARAYVVGDLEVHGDLHATLRELDAHRRPGVRALELLPHLKRWMLRPAPTPAEEAPPAWRRGLRRHTRRRDSRAIEHHYDLSNRFYELLLGPTMTYSCAVFGSAQASLDDAQREKVDLICRKLGLRSGERLLDVGAGWGALVRHAAEHYGVQATGVTLSPQQAEYAARAISDGGLDGRAEVRLLDYRDLGDEQFDAICSVGAMEHFGTRSLASHFAAMAARLREEGRMLNHAIARPSSHEEHRTGPFIDRYVFPDGELQSVATVAGAMQDGGFEVRHEENLREHYALTLREWSANLERCWRDAVAEIGERRARIWRLYLAISRIGFESGRIQIHQVLGVRASRDGSSGMPLRPRWERPAEEKPARRPARRSRSSAASRAKSDSSSA